VKSDAAQMRVVVLRLAPLTEPSQLGISKAEMRFIFNKGTAKVSTTF
jgi:hypothetical protein